MTSLITQSNLARALDNWAFPVYHSLFLAPLLTIQEAERAKNNANDKESPIWLWNSERILKKCHALIWQMTGEWQARRSITISQPGRFYSYMTKGVMSVAKILNRYEIISLSDFKQLDQKRYEKIVTCIENSIIQISGTRLTEEIQPVLGSKVLHHFFPSIVPVYDDKFISKQVLKLKEFDHFIETNADGWLFNEHKQQSRMLEYHRYFAFCSQQICETPSKSLNHLRIKFMNFYTDLAPKMFSEQGTKGLLGRLDAKLAEYCLIGATYR